MEIHELLQKIERVEAPPYFEERVITELASRRIKRAKKNRLRLSLAGAFSAAAVILLVVGLFLLPQREPVAVTSLIKNENAMMKKESPRNERTTVPIIEAVDYAGEFRRGYDQPPVIYILERVSDSTDTETRY
jgi:hypothetical protein